MLTPTPVPTPTPPSSRLTLEHYYWVYTNHITLAVWENMYLTIGYEQSSSCRQALIYIIAIYFSRNVSPVTTQVDPKCPEGEMLKSWNFDQRSLLKNNHA